MESAAHQRGGAGRAALCARARSALPPTPTRAVPSHPQLPLPQCLPLLNSALTALCPLCGADSSLWSLGGPARCGCGSPSLRARRSGCASSFAAAAQLLPWAWADPPPATLRTAVDASRPRRIRVGRREPQRASANGMRAPRSLGRWRRPFGTDAASTACIVDAIVFVPPRAGPLSAAVAAVCLSTLALSLPLSRGLRAMLGAARRRRFSLGVRRHERIVPQRGGQRQRTRQLHLSNGMRRRLHHGGRRRRGADLMRGHAVDRPVAVV